MAFTDLLRYIYIPAVILAIIFILALCCYFFSEYECCPCTRKLSKRRPARTDDVELESVRCLKPPPQQPPPPTDTVHQFKFTSKTTDEIFKNEKGIPTLDLHGLTAEEARQLTRNFLMRHCKGGNLATGGAYIPGNMASGNLTGEGKVIKIVTGRGIHSQGGIPMLKPLVENLLRQRHLKYAVTAKGGAFTITV